MSDPTNPETPAEGAAPAPEVPAAPAEPVYTPAEPVTPPPAAPTPPPAYSAASAAPGPKQTLALTSFITGLAAFVFSWVPVLSLAAGIVAIIVGIRAKNKEPLAPKWMWIVGIIAGAVGALFSIIWGLAWLLPFIIALAAASSNYGY